MLTSSCVCVVGYAEHLVAIGVGCRIRHNLFYLYTVYISLSHLLCLSLTHSLPPSIGPHLNPPPSHPHGLSLFPPPLPALSRKDSAKLGPISLPDYGWHKYAHQPRCVLIGGWEDPHFDTVNFLQIIGGEQGGRAKPETQAGREKASPLSPSQQEPQSSPHVVLILLRPWICAEHLKWAPSIFCAPLPLWPPQRTGNRDARVRPWLSALSLCRAGQKKHIWPLIQFISSCGVQLWISMERNEWLIWINDPKSGLYACCARVLNYYMCILSKSVKYCV